MAKSNATKVVSKKHLARLERERRQTRWITGIAIALITAVVLLIAYGILSQTVLLARQPIVELGDQKVTTSEFQIRVRIRRHQLINQYFQYYQLAQMFGIDPSTDSSFGQQLTAITTELDNSATIGQNIVDEITENLLIRRYAAENGITISEADIEKAMQAGFNYFPDGTSTPTLTPTAVIYATLNATQLALIPPTATATLFETPGVVPTIEPAASVAVDPLASPLPSETPLPTSTPTTAPTATTIPTNTAVPTVTATGTPYTLAGYQAKHDEVFAVYQEYGMTEATFRRIFFEDSLYYDAVYKVVTADVLHEQEQVWARHILVSDEATAQTVRSELLRGASFEALAAIYSLDTSNSTTGGDLGWFASGVMVPEFENEAFKLPIGTISDPVETSYGFHIIQVLGHENRPLTASEYEAAREAAYQEWLSLYKSSQSDLTVHAYWLQRVPTDPTLESIYSGMQTQQAETLEALPSETPLP